MLSPGTRRLLLKFIPDNSETGDILKGRRYSSLCHTQWLKNPFTARNRRMVCR